MRNKETYKNHRFPGQKPGETIELLIRKHWIIDVKIAATLFIVAFIPFLLVSSAEFFAWNGHFNDVFLLIGLAFAVYFLIIVLITYVKWLNEELDIIIITPTRIISHEQIDLFHRQISEANLSQIQDITGTQKGFLQSILHYGKLEIQTSSSDVFFILDHIKNPYENARVLLDLRDKISPEHV